ncbi:tetratricopeptide repeat protein [Cryptosporangium sp. NPDC051539]|uniref:tetratricopeptide repeat protein n=1 Tax=Cryptosporangium sp. NPDC051539 TaxID=3363962 RepID=UPI0037B09A70
MAAHTTATCLLALDRRAEARALALDTLARRRRTLGDHHPETHKSADLADRCRESEAR